MNRRLSSCLLVAALFTAPASAQLISERVDGLRRICTYSRVANVLSGTEGSRVHFVGIGENCPQLPPAAAGHPVPPPTAALRTDEATGTHRSCVYEQAGLRWAYSLPIERVCPPAAGMLVDEQGRIRQR